MSTTVIISRGGSHFWQYGQSTLEKVFTFSNYTVGFHVIDYQPAEVYKQIGLTKKLNAGINLFEVYKEVFARKIIELQVEPVS